MDNCGKMCSLCGTGLPTESSGKQRTLIRLFAERGGGRNLWVGDWITTGRKQQESLRSLPHAVAVSSAPSHRGASSRVREDHWHETAMAWESSPVTGCSGDGARRTMGGRHPGPEHSTLSAGGIPGSPNRRDTRIRKQRGRRGGFARGQPGSPHSPSGRVAQGRSAYSTHRLVLQQKQRHKWLQSRRGFSHGPAAAGWTQRQRASAHARADPRLAAAAGCALLVAAATDADNNNPRPNVGDDRSHTGHSRGVQLQCGYDAVPGRCGGTGSCHRPDGRSTRGWRLQG